MRRSSSNPVFVILKEQQGALEIPACATAERTRRGGVGGRVARPTAFNLRQALCRIWQRRLAIQAPARQRSRHTGQCSARWRRRVVVPAAVLRCPPIRLARSASSKPLLLLRQVPRTARTSRHLKRTPQPTTTPHCPIAAPTLTLVAYVVPANPRRHSSEGWKVQRARQRSAHGAEGRMRVEVRGSCLRRSLRG